jgi:NAD-dependent DNA ligase
VGGGSGLNLGKDRVKKMVEAFGGKVTGSVSGRTHILVVGKEPGLGKVSQAEAQPGCQLMVRFARVFLSLYELDTFTVS